MRADIALLQAHEFAANYFSLQRVDDGALQQWRGVEATEEKQTNKRSSWPIWVNQSCDNLYYLNLKLILWPIKSAAAGSLDENKNQKQLGEAVVNIQETGRPLSIGESPK